MERWNQTVWKRVQSIERKQQPQSVRSPLVRPRQRQRQVRLSEDRVRQLVRDYHAGRSLGELAKRYGINIKTVARHVSKAGVEIRRQEPKISATDLPTIKQLHDAGMSYASIAERYDCSHAAVRTRLLAYIAGLDEELNAGASER